MRIGELAGRLGLNPRTIRFYESIGVLPEPQRMPSGYRDYDASDLERVRFIRLAQSIGLSLDEIAEILAFRDRGEAPCCYVREVIERQANEIDERIRELERARTELRRLAKRARTLPDATGDRAICHLIENEELADERSI